MIAAFQMDEHCQPPQGTEGTEKSLCPLCPLCPLWLFIHMKTALGGEAVYHNDSLAGGRIEACERRAGVIKRDAPSDQFP
jgi:hypothetical protein